MPTFSRGNVIFFQAPEIPRVRTSDPTVQSSVGPTVRSYTRYVAILQTFFITEFRKPAAPQSPVKKKSNIFQGNDTQFPGK